MNKRNPKHLRYTICPLLKRCGVCHEIQSRFELITPGSRNPNLRKPTYFACRVKRDISRRFLPFVVTLPAPCPLLLVNSLRLAVLVTPKVCTGCGVEKLGSEFRWRTDRSTPNARCRECEQGASSEYRQLPEVRAKRKIYTREYEKTPHGRAARLRVVAQRKADGRQYVKGRQHHLAKKFGLALDEYKEMLAVQGGGCAICRRPSVREFDLTVDHCHRSTAVRGLLCNLCNAGLGRVHDAVPVLFAMLQYLNAAPPLIDRSRSYPVKNSRDQHLRRAYGITLDAFNELLRRQGGCCAICHGQPPGKSRGFQMDHVAGTKTIRGVLCSNCNTGLGLFKDDPTRIASAIWYLHKARQAEQIAA